MRAAHTYRGARLTKGYEAQCGDDAMIAAIRAHGNRAHTVQVHGTVGTSTFTRSQVLRRLKYLELHGLITRVATSYKVAIVWGVV